MLRALGYCAMAPFQGRLRQNADNHILFCSFSPVTLSAKHLAVFDDCAATLAPGGDVVALHEFVIELIAAQFATMPLLFPYCEFDIFWESAEVKVMLIACKYVGDDALLSLHLTVAHKHGNALAEGCGVERRSAVLVVEFSPVEALHDSFEAPYVEVGDGPVEHRLEVSPQIVGVRVVPSR